MKNLIFGSALLLSADVSADNESAFSAAEEGDHAATLYELRLLSAQGDANAQYNLAVLKVFQGFNIPEFFEHYSSYFEHKPNLEIDPTKGYTDDWDEVSLKFREQANWKCQDCSVDLSKDRELLHCHHINGVKSDNRSENLQVVCVECHSKKPDHGHMTVTLHNRQRLQQLRNRR